MKTRITEMLRIKHPIIQGGMQNIVYPVLAAAVSNAGGLDTISATNHKTSDSFHEAIREMKQLTDKPFCVNISILPDLDAGGRMRRFVHICGVEQVAVIEAVDTKPDKLVSLIHGTGIIHVHKVPAAHYGISAQSCGMDAVTVMGYECDGYPDMDDVGTMILTNEVSRSLHIPVIVSGRIANGRGIAAALALGVEAVIMGTRFLATTEAPISQNHKEQITHPTETSTTLIRKNICNMMRTADNNATCACLDMEDQGTSLQELISAVSGTKDKEVYKTGKLEDDIFPIEMGCCLIRDIKPVGEVTEELVEEMGHMLGSVAERMQSGKSKATGFC